MGFYGKTCLVYHSFAYHKVLRERNPRDKADLKKGKEWKGSIHLDRLNKVPPGFRGGIILKVIFEVRQILFSCSPERGHIESCGVLECTEITFGWMCLPGREGKSFQINYHATGFSVPWVGGRVSELKMRWDESVHEREQASVEEFPGWVHIRGSRCGLPVLKRDGCLLANLPERNSRFAELRQLFQSPCQSAWVKFQIRRVEAALWQ